MISDLYKKAAELAGRDVEVMTLPNGKFVVLWMSFNSKPPQPGDTEEEALNNFIQLQSSLAADNMVHDTDDTVGPETSSDTETGESDGDNIRPSRQHHPPD